MRIILAVMLCVAFTSVVEAQPQQSLNLMPLPAKVQTGNGQLLIDRNFSVSIAGQHEARLDRAVEIFLGQLRRANRDASHRHEGHGFLRAPRW